MGDMVLIGDGRREIPTISNRRLRALARRIKPVMLYPARSGRIRLYYIRVEDPQRTNIADVNRLFVSRPATGLRRLAVISTLHRRDHMSCCGDHHATVAEVLTQIPRWWLGQTVAFRLPEPDALVYADSIFSSSDVTVLYGRR